MNAPRHLLLSALGLAVLAACSQNPGPPKEAVVATIDGKPVSRNTFEQYAAGVVSKPVAELSVAERDELLDSLVRAAVVAAEAERSGIADLPEVAGTLDIQRLTILERASAAEYLKERQPSEDELRAEYDLRVAQMDKIQYRLSHIQLPTAEEAMKAIEQLDKGANFHNLAQQISQDANSREQGGDLQWSGPSNMPPSFAVAVAAMKKGETSKTPLRSEVGWHVVHLTDTRDAEAPPFESVRDQVVQAVQAKVFQAWTDTLVEKAKITKTP
ncbi:MAG TPA: peptidylprolyl isomerase [Steroidobacteraceae bacterium]|nr:peptidylprolyl isomerase [Steroidobacteraceae bacterium]